MSKAPGRKLMPVPTLELTEIAMTLRYERTIHDKGVT